MELRYDLELTFFKWKNIITIMSIIWNEKNIFCIAKINIIDDKRYDKPIFFGLIFCCPI